MRKTSHTVYLMNASKPHTRKYTVEHTALDAKLEAGSITITHDNIDDDAYTIDAAARATLAIDAAISTTGDGWDVAPLRQRCTQYVEVQDDTGNYTRTVDVDVPAQYTLLQRTINGTTQYALVSTTLLPEQRKYTRII